jgi:hypothetical protein
MIKDQDIPILQIPEEFISVKEAKGYDTTCTDEQNETLLKADEEKSWITRYSGGRVFIKFEFNNPV